MSAAWPGHGFLVGADRYPGEFIKAGPGGAGELGGGDRAGGQAGDDGGGSPVGGDGPQGDCAVRARGEPDPQSRDRSGGGVGVKAGEGERHPHRGISGGVQRGGVQGGVEQGGVDLVPTRFGAVGQNGLGIEVAVVPPGCAQALEGGSVVESGGGELVVEAVQVHGLRAGRGPGTDCRVPVVVVVV